MYDALANSNARRHAVDDLWSDVSKYTLARTLDKAQLLQVSEDLELLRQMTRSIVQV